MIDQLINIEGHLTIFDRGFLKEYFKEDIAKTSAGTNAEEESSQVGTSPNR